MKLLALRFSAKVLLCLGVVAMSSCMNNQEPIRAAIGGPWRNLNPGLQHTAWADLVLANQFESLVKVNEAGILVPLAAKSWSISDDFRTVTFKVDIERRFSDGSHLTAGDFKRSWEESLKLQPISANKSVLDVLYVLEGFDQFQKTGTLTGVVTSGNDTLVLRFQHPFRVALAHLTGSRYAAFKKNGSSFVGTGKYTIAEDSPTMLTLSPNSHREDCKVLRSVELQFTPPSEMEKPMKDGNLDLISYALGSAVPPALLLDSDFEVIPSEEAFHLVVFVNGTHTSILAKPELRLAVQYIYWKAVVEGKFSIPANSQYFSSDPQVFLPSQPGRLDDAEVRELINQGQKYVPQLIAQSKLKPLTVVTSPGREWIINALKDAGVTLSDRSRYVPMDESLRLMYTPDGYDLLGGSFSVFQADPDGIHHALAKTGAILNPVSYRERVSELLEQGRRLTDQSSLDEHYRKISRAILEEVPVFHVGFSRAVAIIRKSRIKVENKTLLRADGRLDVFQAR